MWTPNAAKTAKRIEDLEEYYEKHVPDGINYNCQHYESCKRDCVSAKLNFDEGQLQHVGTKYDLHKDGEDCKPLRLIVSGITYGPMGPVNMGARWKDVVLNSGLKDRVKPRTRTAHATGTTLVLKHILLGPASLATNKWGNWNDEFIGMVGVANDHIFNMCAWINFQLCSAPFLDKNGRATDREGSQKPVAFKCFEHYLETLRILEPHLVVFEAKGWFGRCLKNRGWTGYWQRSKQFPDTLGRFTKDDLDFVACDFYHPSVGNRNNWSSNPFQYYFAEVAVPTLKQALKDIGLHRTAPPATPPGC